MSVHHERILSSMLRSLRPDCPIFTADGEQIGTLSEVADEAIKVNAPLRRDFWIDVDYVRACDDGRVDLSFLKKDLGAYKLDNYRAGDVTVANDPVAEGKTDHIVSDEEQMEIRLRMERELAEQREELPHLHPRGEDGPPDTFGTLGEPVESELSRYGVDSQQFATAAPLPSEGRVPYAKFIAVAAAVVPFVAAVWWLRRRRR